MERRGLLGAILAAGTALASAGSLMKLATQRDDTERLQRMIDMGVPIIGGTYRITRPLFLRAGAQIRGASLIWDGRVRLAAKWGDIPAGARTRQTAHGVVWRV